MQDHQHRAHQAFDRFVYVMENRKQRRPDAFERFQSRPQRRPLGDVSNIVRKRTKESADKTEGRRSRHLSKLPADRSQRASQLETLGVNREKTQERASRFQAPDKIPEDESGLQLEAENGPEKAGNDANGPSTSHGSNYQASDLQKRPQTTSVEAKNRRLSRNFWKIQAHAFRPPPKSPQTRVPAVRQLSQAFHTPPASGDREVSRAASDGGVTTSGSLRRLLEKAVAYNPVVAQSNGLLRSYCDGIRLGTHGEGGGHVTRLVTVSPVGPMLTAATSESGEEFLLTNCQKADLRPGACIVLGHCTRTVPKLYTSWRLQ